MDSAMSATVGASAAGARAMTATASNGLALMHEIVYIAASNRLAITQAAAGEDPAKLREVIEMYANNE